MLDESESKLKNGREQPAFGQKVQIRISASNLAQRMPAAYQTEALEKVKILHSTPFSEMREALFPTSSLLGNFRSVPGSFIEQTYLSSYKYY